MNTNAAASADEYFSVFRDTLIRQYGDAVYRTWFSDLLLADAGGDTVTLSTESDLRRDRLDQQFKLGLVRAWSEHVYPIRRIVIVKRAALSANAAKVNALAPVGQMAAPRSAHAPRLGIIKNGFADQNAGRPGIRAERRAPVIEEIATPLDPRQTFDAFAVDATNEVAVAAARQIFIEDAPREILYFYGPSGVGKSHILQACGNAWMRRYPLGRCAYITHNSIQSGCVDALLSNSTMSFQRDILSNDLVMIDDIHLLAGKQRTLDEVLNLINAISGAGRQLIVAGELAPSKLVDAGIHRRIAERLVGGLAMRITPGGESLRRQVLAIQRNSADLQCKISDEALDIIARLFAASMRECIGAFKQLALVYREKPITVGPNEALAALQCRLGDRRCVASLDDALGAAARAFGLSAEEVKGRAQPQRIVRARHAFVYVARTVLHESFPRIGRALGRDHTTAISSMRRAEALIVREKPFQAAVAAIKVAIGAEIEPERLLNARA